MPPINRQILPRARQPRWAVALVLVVTAALLPFQLTVLSGRTGPRVEATAPHQPERGIVVRDPEPVEEPVVRHEVDRPEPAPKREAPPRRGRLWAFRGLGAWIDSYDFDDVDARRAIATMRANGVRTLYVQTGRYNTPAQVDPEAGRWLEAAHDAGLAVVGWYLPGYKRMPLDVARTVAVARYSYNGHRFDALGIDVEYKALVRHVPRWNKRVALHAQLVRRALGRDYPIAAITPPPLQMSVAPRTWFGFPWRELARSSDLIMLMNYWNYRLCPPHCAEPFTYRNVQITRALVGDPDCPIHVIGGVADSVSVSEVRGFARASRQSGAIGASMYDFLTTRPVFWRILRTLATLS